MPQPSRPEKTMSSRLLAMKFMQRAANAAASGSATPQASDQAAGSPSHEDDADDTLPSTKRQRSDQAATVSSSSDLQAISAAVKAEEEKRAAAVAKQAAEAGETEWVLEFPAGSVAGAIVQPNIVSLGSHDADEAGQGGECDGRREYGGYNRKKRTAEPSQSTSNTVEGENAKSTSQVRKPEDDEYDEINSEFQDQRYRADREEAKRNKLSKQHKKSRGKDKDLSKLTKISGAGISKPDPGDLGRKKNKKGK